MAAGNEEQTVDPKQRAAAQLAAVEQELRSISEWMYANPEIAFEERQSSSRLAAFLGDRGFELEYPAYGLETAFAARRGSSGPEMVICAEYDALPEVGHACGHNIIATAAAGAGAALAGLEGELEYRLTILGTPAEELYGGKVDLIEAGAFEGASAAMMVHPAVDDVVDPNFLAVSHVDVSFHGKESHAAFAPELGVNALDAAVQAYVNISTLRQTLLPTDKVHGVMTYGGAAANVIPALTTMSWYVRAATVARLEELHARVEACFEAAALATGCRVEVEQAGHAYVDLRSDPVLTRLFAANAAALGRPMGRGADREPGKSGSTDMGNVSHVVPSIHPMLDIKSAPFVNHQKEFAAHTVTEDGHRAMRDGALAMAWTVIDLAGAGHWDDLGSS